VIRIAQLLHKHGDLTLTAARALTEHAAAAKINNARHDADRLRSAWKEIESANSRSASLLQEGMPRLVAMAARHFASLSALPRARELLSEAIDSAPAEQRETLFSAMADLSGIAKSGSAQSLEAQAHTIDAASLAKLERWCTQNPRSPAAALAAGSACAELELWGKARVFLKDSARLDTQHSTDGVMFGSHAQRASLLLALIEERLGETDKALKLYRDVAQSSVKS
jgi:HemY protein